MNSKKLQNSGKLKIKKRKFLDHKKFPLILLYNATVYGGPTGTRTPDRPVMSRML